jgi:hypothetical protein
MEKIVAVLLVISLSVWGYILFGNVEFMQWAEGNWNLALILWMGMSVLNVVGLLAALSISGIAWAGKSEEYAGSAGHGTNPLPGNSNYFPVVYNDYEGYKAKVEVK